MLSAGADLVSPIIIVYQLIVRLFSCGLRGISIGDLPASLPIKGWISLPNHATYAHNSGIRRHIYGKSALSIPYSPLMDCHFYTSANGERAASRICLVSFLRYLHWRIVTSTLLQMENGRWAVYALCSSFVVSIDGLLLLHFCKWRTDGEPYMPCVLPSLSPLTDCYFYTSVNGEPPHLPILHIPWQKLTFHDYKWQAVPSCPLLPLFCIPRQYRLCNLII